MQILQDVLYQHHGYYHLYKTAFERIHELGDVPDLHVYLHFSPTTDQRRYNLPTAEEVAVIIPGDGTQPTENRDIILSTCAGPLKCITEINPAFQCLYYVLLFPYGEHGWHINIPLTLGADENPNMPNDNEEPNLQPGEEGGDENGAAQRRNKRAIVSQVEYYAYCLHSRRNESDHLFRAKALF